MKQKKITTQKELDKLKEIKIDESVFVQGTLELKSNLHVFGICTIDGRLTCRSGALVAALGNSSVEVWGNSSVVALGNSSVVALGNSSVEVWGNSSVEARDNSSVVALGNSSVVAWDNSSVVAWDNSSVEALGNSSVVARDNSVIRIFQKVKEVILYGFSVCFKPIDLKFSIKKKSKTVIIQNIRPLDYFERNGIDKTKKIILYKRVSHDYKTQEDTANETLWLPKTTIEHPSWEPKLEECGQGKFHAVSKPYFADEFRSKQNDRYIAIAIDLNDLYEWKNNPSYPHKIGFRRGKVLHEVDKFGRRIK
jgi:hypothetical protein